MSMWQAVLASALVKDYCACLYLFCAIGALFIGFAVFIAFIYPMFRYGGRIATITVEAVSLAASVAVQRASPLFCNF